MYDSLDDFLEEAKIKIINKLTDMEFDRNFSVNDYRYSESVQYIKVIFTKPQSDRMVGLLENLFTGNSLFSGITCTNDFKEFNLIFSIKSKEEYYVSVINRDGKDGYLMWETDAMYIGDTIDRAYHYTSVDAAIQAGQTVAQQYNIEKPTIKVLQITKIYETNK